MPGRVLVVDDVEANVRLLEAKLQAEYYQILTARNGQAALDMAQSERPDVILLDVMMPGMDGFEVCRRLKRDEATSHIPVVLVTALDGRAERITGLEAGADEFLTKPIDDLTLLARVKSLTRLKMVIDELRQREATGRRLGMAAAVAKLGGAGGRVLIVDDQERQAGRIAEVLTDEHRPIVESDPEKGHLSAKGPVDLVIVNATAKGFDGLRFGAELRAEETTRHLPILGVVDPNDRARLVKALEIGFNDVIARPVDPEELIARVKSLIKGKRYADFLRNHLEHSLELAVTDPLTGLHNRRYMEGQLAALTKRAERGGEPVAALMLDLDHFKHINDSFGHDAGDDVLRVFAVRLASNVRAMDLPCRYGGEEFLVIMPDTRLEDAHRIAERIRKNVAGSPFKVGEGGDLLDVTISIGVAATLGAGDTAQALLKRADRAVYEAKAAGRNVVVARAA